jgi:hypothetical protein
VNYLKIISYIFVVFYLVFTICKFYFWWEGYTFPIAFHSNRLQNFCGKLFYLPIVISLVILTFNLFDKKYIALKMSILIVILLLNLALYITKELTSQWYDIGKFEDGTNSQILHSSEIINERIEPLNYRVVKKTKLFSVFCWVELSEIASPISNENYSSNTWISYPIEINLDD